MDVNPFDFQKQSEEPIVRVPRRNLGRHPHNMLIWGAFLLLVPVILGVISWLARDYYRQQYGIEKELQAIKDGHRIHGLQTEGESELESEKAQPKRANEAPVVSFQPKMQGDGSEADEQNFLSRRLERLLASRHHQVEPLKKTDRWKWSVDDYRLARALALSWQKSLDNGIGPSESYWLIADLPLRNSTRFGELAREIMPKSITDWTREGQMQALKMNRGLLDFTSRSHPYLYELQNDDVRSRLRARAVWQERRRLYEKLIEITGDKRGWNLHHPFDDLNASEMNRCILAAEKAKQLSSSRQLTDENLAFLITADQLEFLADLSRR